MGNNTNSRVVNGSLEFRLNFLSNLISVFNLTFILIYSGLIFGSCALIYLDSGTIIIVITIVILSVIGAVQTVLSRDNRSPCGVRWGDATSPWI